MASQTLTWMLAVQAGAITRSNWPNSLSTVIVVLAADAEPTDVELSANGLTLAGAALDYLDYQFGKGSLPMWLFHRGGVWPAAWDYAAR